MGPALETALWAQGTLLIGIALVMGMLGGLFVIAAWSDADADADATCDDGPH